MGASMWQGQRRPLTPSAVAQQFSALHLHLIYLATRSPCSYLYLCLVSLPLPLPPLSQSSWPLLTLVHLSDLQSSSSSTANTTPLSYPHSLLFFRRNHHPPRLSTSTPLPSSVITVFVALGAPPHALVHRLSCPHDATPHSLVVLAAAALAHPPSLHRHRHLPVNTLVSLKHLSQATTVQVPACGTAPLQAEALAATTGLKQPSRRSPVLATAPRLTRHRRPATATTPCRSSPCR